MTDEEILLRLAAQLAHAEAVAYAEDFELQRLIDDLTEIVAALRARMRE